MFFWKTFSFTFYIFRVIFLPVSYTCPMSFLYCESVNCSYTSLQFYILFSLVKLKLNFILWRNADSLDVFIPSPNYDFLSLRTGTSTLITDHIGNTTYCTVTQQFDSRVCETLIRQVKTLQTTFFDGCTQVLCVITRVT